MGGDSRVRPDSGRDRKLPTETPYLRDFSLRLTTSLLATFRALQMALSPSGRWVTWNVTVSVLPEPSSFGFLLTSLNLHRLVHRRLVPARGSAGFLPS